MFNYMEVRAQQLVMMMNQMLYTVDPDAEGPAEQFSFNNPDFNFKSLRGNVVLRWEALPGSVFYFAWTNSRMNFDDPGELNFKNDFRNLVAYRS